MKIDNLFLKWLVVNNLYTLINENGGKPFKMGIKDKGVKGVGHKAMGILHKGREEDFWETGLYTSFSALIAQLSSLSSHRSALIAHLLSLTSHRSPLIAHLSSLTSPRSPLIAHLSSLIAHLSSLIAHLSSLTSHTP